MTCFLTATSCYPNQCWHIVNGVVWHSPKKITGAGPRFNMKTVFPRFGHSHVKDKPVGETGIGICFKQHFDTRYLAFYNTSPPRMFLSLDLLWEYRIQHGANGPLYVTSSYSTWIFCRGVSGFATDCPCGKILLHLHLQKRPQTMSLFHMIEQVDWAVVVIMIRCYRNNGPDAVFFIQVYTSCNDLFLQTNVVIHMEYKNTYRTIL